MKDKLLNTILTEIAEEAAPSRQIDILPGLKKSLDKSNRHFIPRFNQGDTDMIHSIKPGKLLPRAALIGVALVIVLAAFFSSDQGQALAQKLFQFFRVTEEKSFVLPTDQMWTNPATPTPVPPYILPLVPAPVEVNPTPLPTVDSTCSTPASQKTYFCQNQKVEAEAGFDLKEFVYDPKGMKYAKVSYFPETGEARTEFVVTGGYLYLVQGINEYISTDNPWTMVPSDAVKQVSVNGNYAEIVEGTYAYYLGATEAVWDPYGRIRLFWREGNRWFLLEKIGEPYPIEWMTPEELVRLAESLVDQRLLDAVPPVDTENLLSVAAAQELAGYDLLSPSLLPEGYVFKRASYAGEVVRLLNVALEYEIIRKALATLPPHDDTACGCRHVLAAAVVTAATHVPPATRKKMALFVPEYRIR